MLLSVGFHSLVRAAGQRRAARHGGGDRHHHDPLAWPARCIQFLRRDPPVQAVTSLLATTLALFAAFALYIAAQSAKSESSPAAYVDAGQNLPSWTYIFAGSGVLLASIGPYDYLRLLSAYGFQANQLALSLILVALAAALFQKRLWLAARITGSRSLGELFGAHFQSTSIRIYSSAGAFPLRRALCRDAPRLRGRTAGAGER